jgi:hypothetical protein
LTSAADLIAQLEHGDSVVLPDPQQVNDIWDLPWVRPVYVGQNRQPQDQRAVHIVEEGPFEGGMSRPHCGIGESWGELLPAGRPDSEHHLCQRCQTNRKEFLLNLLQYRRYLSPATRLVMIKADAQFSYEYLKVVDGSDPLVPAAIQRLDSPNSELIPELQSDAKTFVIYRGGLPSAILAQLSTDPSDYVRFAVANNPHTPACQLTELLRDKDMMTAQAAVDNPSLPPAARAMWQLAHGQP